MNYNRLSVRRFVGLCAIGIFFVACSSDMEDSFPPVVLDYQAEIQPVVTIDDDSSGTRAGGVIDPAAAIAVSFFRADKGATAYPSGWTGVTALPANIAVTTGAVALGTSQYYQVNGYNTKLVGVYPAVTAGGTWTPTATTGTVAYTIDGATDIMATAPKEGNKSSGIPALAFEHLLTQVIVTVTAEDAAVSTKWGNLTNVTISGSPALNNLCTVTLLAPSDVSTAVPVASFGGTASSLTVWSKAGTTPTAVTADTSTKTFGYCLFAPMTTTLTLTVTTGNATSTVSVTSTAYAAKMSYAINLKMTQKAITATGTTIGAWGTGTSPTPSPVEL